ncbi:MAG TPA: hypothetical protein VHS58_13610 [Acetobacteraceae bacterium]|jgi:hypothetical protein|nr:hypothetical protein [Acetobacteraceae bacterium]
MCTDKAPTTAEITSRMTYTVMLGLVAALCAGTARATPAFTITNLISDGAVPAVQPPDPKLINPWGVSFSPTGPFWVSDNGAGVITFYDGAGAKQSLFGGTLPEVTIATPPGQPAGTATPTGQVFNGNGGFDVTATIGGVVK